MTWPALSQDWQSLGSAGDRSDRAHFIAKVAGLGRTIPDLALALQEVLVAGERIMTIDIHRIAGGRLVQACHIEDWMTALPQSRGQG